MEPDSVSNIAKRAEEIRSEVLRCFGGTPPKLIEYVFGDTSFFFHEEALAEWRRQERYDELIEYILCVYEEGGGEELWQQVLLDLRLKKDELRAHILLDGLYPARAKKFRVALKNYRKFPENHFSAASCAVAKGDVMKVLYEHAFLLENKPEGLRNHVLVEMVRSRIREIIGEKKTPD